MGTIREKIIDYLVKNRVSTTEVADCLGKSGALNGIMPVNRGHYAAGELYWVYANAESNWTVHEQISNMEEGKIIYIEAFDCGERAILGELVSKYVLLYRQCKAIIVSGNVRDASALIRENFPIWCKGFNPIGCFNQKPEKELDESVHRNHYQKYNGAIGVCDDCGAVIIPKENITESFLQSLKNIENQEDIWFDRLDHYKENTFEIVCQKKYLEDAFYMERHK